MTDEPTIDQGHEQDQAPDVLTAVNRLLSRAADLLSESHPPTEEQDQAERAAANLIARAGRVVTSGRIMAEETGREGWTPEERALWDARADNEEWSHAWSLLNPMVDISREVGNPSLVRIMEQAMERVEDEVNRTLDVLEPLVEKEEK